DMLGTGSPREAVVAVAAHPTRPRLAGVTDLGRVLVWEWLDRSPNKRRQPRGKLKRPGGKARPRVPPSGGFTRKGDRLAVVFCSEKSSELVIVDMASGKVVYEVPGFAGIWGVWGVCFHPTVSEVVVSSDHSIQVHDYSQRKRRLEVPLTNS